MVLKDLRIGSNLEIGAFIETTDNRVPYYHVKIQNIRNDGVLEVDVPSKNGQMIFFQVNALIEAVLVASDGVYSFKGKVLDRVNKNNIFLLIMKPENEMEKTQRRSFFRLNCNIMVKYREYKMPVLGETAEEFKITNTVNISGGGLCIITQEKIDNLELIECGIILNEDTEVVAVCKVMNITKNENNEKQWKVGLRFERISEQGREKLINYIFEEQRRLRRKGLI